MMALFCSVKLETSGGRTFEYIDHYHSNLLMYKLLTSTGDEYGFVRNQVVLSEMRVVLSEIKVEIVNLKEIILLQSEVIFIR